MSYTSGINQRFRQSTLYSNYTAEDVDITNTNLSLIANLKYVQNWFSSIIVNYLPILNPNFQGSLTSSTGGNIAVSSLTVPTITSNTNFLIPPTIQSHPVDINYTGEITISIYSTPPPNTLLCDGRSVSATQYRALYLLIGTAYGGGNGMFNLPNFTSYFPIGGNSTIGGVPASNFSGGASSVSCNFGGASSVAPPILTKMPAHNHSIQDSGHFHYISIEEDSVYGLEPGEGILNPMPYGINTFYSPDYTTGSSATGITLEDEGIEILKTDPISGLNGVNISPPYLAVFYYITY